MPGSPPAECFIGGEAHHAKKMLGGVRKYVFWAESGYFQWIKRGRIAETLILEARPGSLRLLKPPRKLYQRTAYLLGMAGAVVGNATYYFTRPLIWSSSVESRIVALSAFAVVASAYTWMVGRIWWPYLARNTSEPGLEVQVETIQWNRRYHSLLVRGGGQLLRLTVGGWPRRVRKALELAGSKGLSNSASSL